MTEKYTFFWGENFDNGYLSQWYPSQFQMGGLWFATAEHFMMSQKATLFEDFETYDKIMESKCPKEAKALGRQVKNFDAKAWGELNEICVFMGNLLKFSQNPEIFRKLINTNDSIIAEASPYDNIWGVGLRASDPKILNEDNWGQNLLGKALMKVRRVLTQDL